MYTALWLQNYFTRTEKKMSKALQKAQRLRVSLSLHLRGLSRCCRLENPQRSRRASVSEHLMYAFHFRRCCPLGLPDSPLAALVHRLLCQCPFICPRITFATYLHNLQRTTPTVFSRFSRVRRALCLPVVTFHRLARRPSLASPPGGVFIPPAGRRAAFKYSP